MGWDDYDTPPSTSPRSVISSFTGLSEPEEPLLVLDSLFSVVERLPGFTKHQTSGYYYVQGRIDEESLYDYTKRIGELTLGAEDRLATHVLVRIARLQDTLFPSLRHLSIVRTSKYLDFLDIFLSSALTTIELTALSDDDPHYSSVLSFLESAIDRAPLISTLILGPGRIQDQILHMSSKYQQLRRLEMRNVGVSITDELLRNIGLLQHLETFVLLDNGTSEYSCSPAIPTTRKRDLETEGLYAPCPVFIASRWTRGFSPELRISYATDDPIDPPKSPPAVIPDLSEYATSPGPRRQQDLEPEEMVYVPSHSPCQGLYSESRIFYATDQVPLRTPLDVRSLFHGPTVSYGHDAAFVGTSVAGPSPFPALRTLEVDGSFSLIEGLVTKVNPSNLQTLSIDFTKSRTPKQFWPNCGPIVATTSTSFQQLPQAPSGLVPDIVTLLSCLIQTWGNTLVSISLKSDITTFSLPSDLFENLLLCPNMKRLEINGIGIDSKDIELHRLEEVVYSKLEVLHLPVDYTAPSIPFIELRYIVENFPHLKSLRCRLRSFWDIPVPVPKSHGLEVLSVSNAELPLEHKRLFEIARYLDSAFPNLKTIKTHYKNGCNAEQWDFISDLVKVCQAVRRDECARHGI